MSKKGVNKMVKKVKELKETKKVKKVSDKYFQVYAEYIESNDGVIKARSKKEALEKFYKENFICGHVVEEACEQITKQDYLDQGGEE